jgi:FtsP/CotA-like multicopper oxidase with cupredoxin domain
MKSPVSRREFVALSGGVIAGAALTSATSRHAFSNHLIPHFEVPLPIPRVLQPVRTDATTDYYEIVQREACVEILPGRHTTIWGYEGTFPGPTIKARRGRTAIVRHVNRLGTPTVVHLHGGVTPPESDGFPMDHVMPGEARAYVYPNTQRAATLWYHDHAMDRTGRNIYMGLSGLYLLEDDDERVLGLPDGPYDVPLLIQDRLFAADGSFHYKMVNHLGAKGGTLLVNGAPWPRLDVSTRTYRFRIVNGSNATPLRLALSSGDPLIQIATDGGLLPAPVVCRQIPLAMAERVEVIVDFSRHSVGTDIVLQNLNTRGATGSISNEIMQFHVARVEREARHIPGRLAETEALDRSAAVRTRQFVFSVQPSFGPLPSPSWRINGRRFEAEIPIASPRYGDVEIWRFTNKRFLGALGIVHPVHVHLVRFKVLQRNGGPPLPHETGWKDTVSVDRDEDVSVIARFEGYRGRYLVHCHNLEHEDHSMMARFDVV